METKKNTQKVANKKVDFANDQAIKNAEKKVEAMLKEVFSEPSNEMKRMDTATKWVWDFKWNGHLVWIVAEKHQDSNWLENKHGELVGVAEWVSRFFVDGEEIQSVYNTQKWYSWENRIAHLKSNYEEKVPVVTEAVQKAKKKVAKVKKQLSGLNEKEQLVLQALYANAMDCTGGEFGFTEDVIAECEQIGMTKNQIKGYIGSIRKKDLAWIVPTDSGYQQFGFTDKGWKVLFDLNISDRDCGF